MSGQPGTIDTTSDVGSALAALRRRNAETRSDLAAKVALATELDLSLAHRERAQDTLVEYCSERLLRQVSATDRALYTVAADHAQTRLLVRALRAHHRLIAERVAALDRASSAAEVAEAAHAISALLDACHLIELDVLVPALASLPGADLPEMVEDLSTRTGTLPPRPTT